MLNKIKQANKRWRREQRRKFMRRHLRRTQNEYQDRVRRKNKKLEMEAKSQSANNETEVSM